MAEDGAKSFQLLKCLKKFDGQVSTYPEWKYNTRRTIGLYKPDISRLLSGSWNPEPQYEYYEEEASAYRDEHDHGNDEAGAEAGKERGNYDDDGDKSDGDDEEPDGDSEVAQLRKDLTKAKNKARFAAEDFDNAKKTLKDKSKSKAKRVTKAQAEA